MAKALACLMAAASLVLLVLADGAKAQDSFYQGKTVRIIVGASAGGGYDTYTRAIARHIGKHIPGNPDVLVQNMPGASSVTAANRDTSSITAGNRDTTSLTAGNRHTCPVTACD